MRYFVKKAAVLVLTLFVISFLAFFAFQIIPGDPTVKILGMDATPEQIHALREELGLNRPFLVRYTEWLTGFVTGDLGRSYSYNMQVSELVGGKIPVTAALSVIAFLFVTAISIPAGILAAGLSGRPGKTLAAALSRSFSTGFMALNQIVMSVPPFFTGIIFTYVFGLVLKLFTPGGFVSYNDSIGRFLAYLIFPSLAIALPRSAMVAKLLRGSILAELESDYVRTAYSRGNTRRRTLGRHVLRNSFIPVVTFLAMTLADIVAGSIIVEQVFAIPGIGRLLLLSISNRDFPVVQTIVVIIAAIVVTVNFAADIAYQYIDPRIRLR